MQPVQPHDVDPAETTISRLVEERGPLAISDTPYNDTNPDRERIRRKLAKHAGVRILYPPASNLTDEGSFTPGLQHTPVLYHEDHEPDDVVETYLDENPQILENSSSWAVYCVLRGEYDDETFRAGARDVLRRRDPEGWQH